MNAARNSLKGALDAAALNLDLARAVRTCMAVSIPLVIGQTMGHLADALFVALTAEMIANQDIRGSYPMRVAILATMTLVAAGAAFLGAVAGHSLAASVLAMAAVALLGGCWRHLSADYGHSLSIASALVFLIGLSQPETLAGAGHRAAVTALGGLWATVLHVGYWLFRAQHPLRYAVAETWVAASDLAAAMRIPDTAGRPRGSETIAQREGALRAALDRTFAILGAVKSRGYGPLVKHLEAARSEVVHFTMALTALHTAIQAGMEKRPNSSRLPAADALLETLSNVARSVAVTLVIHRPENLAASELRMRRCEDLLRILMEELSSAGLDETCAALFQNAAAQIRRVLERLRATLAATIGRQTPRAAFPSHLPELSGRNLRSLAAWINPGQTISPLLIRHTARAMVLTMIAVAIYKGLSIPRGYWIAFSIIVVLQPDYGATRRRAVERVTGTLAGSALGSVLLWISLPVFLLDALIALTTFCFAYFLKRRYDIAIFFVTLFLVLLTETMATVHLDFTIARSLSVLLGSGMALVAALLFWHVSEREKFPPALAAALRANRAFMEAVAIWLADPMAHEHSMLLARRAAENANRIAGALLDRWSGERTSQPANTERAALLMAYSHRLTRMITVMAVPLPASESTSAKQIGAAISDIGAVLEQFARMVESGVKKPPLDLPEKLARMERELSADKPDLIHTHLAKCTLEIRAMIMAAA